MIESGNLFAGIPDILAAEQLTALLAKPNSASSESFPAATPARRILV